MKKIRTLVITAIIMLVVMAYAGTLTAEPVILSDPGLGDTD